MSREKELIKEIDNHIGKAGRLYGLEFPDSDLEIIREALAEKCTQTSRIEAGDVVTDHGYHGQIVITRIEKSGLFCGYYVADGATVSGLEIKKFEKIADKSGEWKSCRGGVYFQKREDDAE